ncbi:MAG: hypothetical protein ABL886_00410 [Rhodoglobus sp.]
MRGVGFLRRRVRFALRTALLAGLFPRRSKVFGTPDASTASIVMCLWNRPSRITPILTMLDGQDYPGGVELFLWNNNRREHQPYVDAIREFEATGAVRAVHLARSPHNLGSIGRFVWARQIGRSRPGSAVIVLDDDQDVQPDFVTTLMAKFDPKRIFAWWAWVVVGGYHDRKPAEVGGRVDHIGPGASVMTVDIFADRKFFTDIPDRFRMLDDLWLTSYARRHGYPLEKLDVPVEFVMDETNQYHTQIGAKAEFFDYLYPES